MRRAEKWLLVGAVLAAPAAAAAGETVTYSYDALGRLTDVAVEGGANAGSAAATRYDPAGNRTSYGVSGAGASGLAPASQASSSRETTTGRNEMAAGLDEPDGVGEISPALVEPPPPGGIPDESEPVVEIENPDAGAAAASGREL
jgi:RHS Repeat